MHGQSSYSYKRAQRHLWADGIREIMIGIGAILYALFMALQAEFSSDKNVWLVASVLLSAGVIFAGVVMFRRVGDRLKAGITYPRTGFVSLKRPRRDLSARKVIAVMVLTPLASLAGVGLVLGALFAFALVKINASLLLLSAMLAFPAASVGWRTGLARLYLLAGAILLIGVSLTVTDTFGPAGIILLFGLTGLAVSSSGAFALVHYLRIHPASQDEEPA